MSNARFTTIGANGPAFANWAGSVDGASSQRAKAEPRYRFVSWLTLIGLVIPAWEAHVLIAGAKFTAGRLAVTILAIPALVFLFRRGRRFMPADLAAGLTAAWMIGAAASAGGLGALSSPMAESLQFLFAYFVGRAFYGTRAALDSFVRILAAMTFIMILIAVVEQVTGRWVAHDVAGAIFGETSFDPVFRNGTLRSTSTLDHPILFGVFCALVNAILMQWEQNVARRILFSTICFAGCVLSQSSASLMAYVLGVAAYAYDRLLRNFAARWSIFWLALGVAIGFVFLIADRPIGWIVSHMTLEPESGYYRMLIWEAAFDRIGQSPITGYSFELFHEDILDATVDCVWLVEALRYGIPTIVFLFWANMAAVWPARQKRMEEPDDYYKRMNLAFTMVLLLYVFSGITVHFWNYMWIFWGLCIGIKVALKERPLNG